jgi:hypothetical protein
MQSSTSVAWALLVAICAWFAVFGGTSGDSGTGTVIDGLAFPSELKMAGTTQRLTGGGTRTKYGVAKVYAAALYVDTGGASTLKKHTATAKFYAALIDGTFARTLSLQFHRSVSSEVMVGALDEAMAKRLPADTVAKFRDALSKAFGAGAIAKGAEVYFMCRSSTLSIGSGTVDVAATLKDKSTRVARARERERKRTVAPHPSTRFLRCCVRARRVSGAHGRLLWQTSGIARHQGGRRGWLCRPLLRCKR